MSVNRPYVRIYRSPEEITEASNRLGIKVKYMQTGKGKYIGTLPTQAHSKSTFISETTSTAVSVHGEIDKDIYVVVCGNEKLVVNGKSNNNNQLVVYPPGSEMYVTASSAGHVMQICLPRELVEKYLFTSNLEVSPPSNPAPFGISVVPDVSERLRSLVKSLAVTNSPNDSLAEDIEYFLLESLTHSNFSLHNNKTCGRGRPIANYDPQFKQAIEFIHENLQSPISLTELCLSINTPLRTLQRVFIKHTGLSPKRYILASRLNAIRKELLTASKIEVTVSEIALKYDLKHFGRFAAAYYELFQEHPRDTLVKK